LSDQLTAEQWSQRPFAMRLLQNLARLFDSLL
jgi:hypothetical protein